MKDAEPPQARKCQNCGTPAGKTERFCPKCGTWIRRSSFAPVPTMGLQSSSRGFQTRLLGQSRVQEEEDESLPPISWSEKSEEEAASGDPSLLERPFSEIKQEVESNGLEFETLPGGVKRILSNREHYVVKYKLLEEREAEYGRSLEDVGIHELVAAALEKSGTQRLYKFQEEAMLAILRGENVVVAAPTGNGKTIAFAVPIFHKILLEKETLKQEDEEGQYCKRVRALFIYPTKALARDQLRMLGALKGTITLGVFDGDTPSSERQKILDSPPDVIISNFDTVEYHLRNNTHFAELLRTLKYVVIDELHTYVGAFGTHVHFILRRLKRILREPEKLQLIGSSATVRNPGQFAGQLFNNSSVTEVRCETGRRGRIHFVMLYPTRTSMTGMMAGCVRSLLSSGMKTLVFANTHKNAEVLNLALRHAGIQSEIHRAGLMKSQRVEVEDSFKQGLIRSLVATPTLELGIDIGDLDAVVSMITGITNLTQRMGRAGRKGQESVVVLAMRGEDPISAYYRNHPDTYFADISPAYVEPRNPIIARLEILAASMDRPISADLREFYEFSALIQELVEQKFLVERIGRLWPTSLARNEVAEMNIRGIGETVAILDATQGKVIGERQLPMALRELFPGSLYLLGGRKYESVSFENRGGVRTSRIRRLPDSHAYKTEALRYSLPKVIDVLEKKHVRGTEAEYCSLTITEVVEGYIKKEIFTDKRVGPKVALEKPLSYTYETKGFVFRAPVPHSVLSSSSNRDGEKEDAKEDEDVLGGSFHALEHALIEGSDSLTGSGSFEVGGVSMGDSGVIFVYDGSPGGSGLTKLLYDRLEEAFERTLSILKECKCTSRDGCPLCTYSYQCGNNNDPLNKLGAIESLELILQGKTKIPEVQKSDYNEKKSYL